MLYDLGMGGRLLEPNIPGKITIVPLKRGGYRCKSRLRTLDYTRRDLVTGAYLPAERVIDVMATVTDKRDAQRAINKKAKAIIEQAKKADRAKVEVARAEALITVGESATRVLDALAGTGEVVQSTLYVYRLHSESHLKDSDLGMKPVADVTTLDIRNYLSLVAANVGVASARQGRAVIHRVFRWALDAGVRSDDPSIGVKIIRPAKDAPSATRKRTPLDHKRALTRAERGELAWAVARDPRAADPRTDPRVNDANPLSRGLDTRDLVLAGMSIGGRISEVIGLRWQDVDLEAGTVTISGIVDRVNGEGLRRAERTKTDSSVRTIPLPRRTVALFKRRARAAGLALEDLPTSTLPVFPNTGRGTRVNSWRDRSNTSAALREVFDAAGFDWLSFHGLRRSAITAIADVLPLRLAADFAGHASVRTTADSYIGRSAVSTEVTKYL